jgi:hypothetical protein
MRRVGESLAKGAGAGAGSLVRRRKNSNGFGTWQSLLFARRARETERLSLRYLGTSSFDVNTNSLTRFASVALTTIAVGTIVASTSMTSWSTVLALWLFLFVTGFVLHTIEARVFSEGPSTIGRREFAGAAVLALLFGVGGAFLARESSLTFQDVLRQYVEHNGFGHATLQVALCAISYMVAYCVIGSATFPFVRPYYEGPDRVMNLRVPSGSLVIALQLGRGLLATLALLPLIAAGFPGAPFAWLRVAIVWAITGAIVPLLNAEGWPWRLRAIHALEITIFAAVQSYAWWRLLA